MRSGFYAVGARWLLAIVRGWLWLGERLRAPGERPIAHPFFLGLLGLSISMTGIDFVTAFDDRHRQKTRLMESFSFASDRNIGYNARRAPRTRHTGSAKTRPRDPDSRLIGGRLSAPKTHSGYAGGGADSSTSG